MALLAESLHTSHPQDGEIVGRQPGILVSLRLTLAGESKQSGARNWPNMPKSNYKVCSFFIIICPHLTISTGFSVNNKHIIAKMVNIVPTESSSYNLNE